MKLFELDQRLVEISYKTVFVLLLGFGSAILQTSCGGCGGDAKGCIERGEEYAFKSGLRENHAKGFELFQELCNSGNEKGCDDLLSMCLERKCAPEEAAKAAQIFRAACDGGTLKRCAALGVVYARGMGVQEDDAKAEQLFEKACNGGSAVGCGHLGGWYASQSLGEVLNCGRSSCIVRMLLEPFEFALAFLRPNVDQTFCTRAIIERVNHRRTTSSDCAETSFVLGARYGTSRSVREDDAKAAQLYQKACDGGDGLGCLNLSNMYRNGLGVRKDTTKAAQVATRGFSLIKTPEPLY